MIRTFMVFGLVFVAWRACVATPLSESEYLASLGEASPALQALEGPVTAAQGMEQSARLFSNPALSVDREAPGDVEQMTYGLSWVPPIDGRRGLIIDASRAAVDAARSELAWNTLLTRTDLRRVYAEWTLAHERAAIVRSHLDTFRAVVDKARERTRLGEESGLATQRLVIALVEMEAAGARAEADLAEKEAVAMGRVATTYTDPEPSLPPLPAFETAPDGMAHPILAAHQAEVRVAEFRQRLSGRFLSSPELRIGWQTLDEAGVDSDGLVVGGEWPVPLFDRRQGERVESAGRLRAAKARLAVDERQIQAEIRGAEAKYRRLRAAAQETRRALEGSDQVLERAAARFHLGESDVTDLLEATRSLISSQIVSLELYGEALEAHRRLELAAGRILAETPGGGR